MIAAFQEVLDDKELKTIQALLSQSQFIDGKKTAGYRAKRVKNNKQVSWNEKEARDVQSIILNAVKRHQKLVQCCHPKEIATPLISKSSTGMGYGFHVDDAQIGAVGSKNRSDISMTIFLCQPDEYEGGELEIITPYGATAFKLPAGQAITYPSKFLHQVRTVTSGERLVAVSWMQSHIRNEQDREILLELDQVNQKLHQLAPDAVETDLGFKIYANLKRRWVE